MSRRRPGSPARARLRTAAALTAAGLLVVGCGGSSPSAPRPTSLPLNQLLRLPVATPTSCPPGVHGSASGRLSPWVGRVDLSVFLRNHATDRERHTVRRLLDRDPRVQDVFVETSKIAYEEYQRLYTCSADVPAGFLPASYRVTLRNGVPLPRRNSLVRRLMTLPAVASVSCDPSAPCTGITRERH